MNSTMMTSTNELRLDRQGFEMKRFEIEGRVGDFKYDTSKSFDSALCVLMYS
jgi:hypothetical protein